MDEELRWRSTFLEAQVHASLDGILVVDAQGKKILQNQRCVELWKIPAEVVNSPDDQQQIRWVMSMTQDPGQFVQRIKELYARPGEKSRDEIALKDGRTLDRYSAPVIGEDGSYYGRIWTFRDITERKELELSLRESQARFQRITDNVPGMVYRFVLRPDGSYTLPFVSEGCRQIYGLGPEQIRQDAQLLVDCVHPEDREEHARTIASSAASLMPWSWQGRIQRWDNGQTRWVQGASQPDRQPDGSTTWDGVLVDVTERHQAEEDRQAKGEADRSNREKSQFLSRVSHELRTPLNSILGFGQLLQASALQGQDAEALTYILKSGKHLLGLVDEVLDLSRAESGELCLVPTQVDAGELVRECLHLVAYLAQAHQINCRFEDFEPAIMLWCDGKRLRQVLLNLLSNAIKYNRKGGEVWVRGWVLEGRRLRLEVTDTGAGIAPDDLTRLFVPFVRLQAGREAVEGVGLGLVVSRRVAEVMGGKLELESTVGEGSTCWVELPLGEASCVEPSGLEVDTDILRSLLKGLDFSGRG